MVHLLDALWDGPNGHLLSLGERELIRQARARGSPSRQSISVYECNFGSSTTNSFKTPMRIFQLST